MTGAPSPGRSVPVAGGRAAPAPLVARYRPADLGAFTAEELERFLGPLGLDPEEAAAGGPAWRQAAPALAWELLYRVEPELYDRLTAGERLHPGILAWLPDRIERAVEVGAGAGRMTLDLAGRCDRLLAVEPAAPMRAILSAKLAARSVGNVRVAAGFLEDIPAADASADLVIACSAFTRRAGHGGEAGLAEMRRVCRPGGLVVVVWPDDAEWLRERGFDRVSFEGEMAVEFGSSREAVELARIFYPDAAAEVERRGDRLVPYDVLGVPAPRDLCWWRKPA